MQLKDLYLKYNNLPHLELEVIFAYILKLTPTQLFSQTEKTVSSEELALIENLIQRRLNNEPIAYLINQKEFFGIPFYVDSNVLIPRPETEELVELGLNSKPNSILDIGTGSGAIACTFAHQIPNSKVTALDISAEALKIAAQNTESLNLKNINFIQSDFLAEIPANSHFDLIITNPPYVKTSDQEFMAEETKKFEPELALFSGADGLDAYRQILSEIKTKNISFNTFLGEFGFNQENELRHLLEIDFSGKYTLLKDLAGITRFIKIQT